MLDVGDSHVRQGEMPLAFRAAVLAVVVISFAAADDGDDALLTSPSHGFTGRSLLQLKKNCPVNLETANYTEVTSRCKGPVYNESRCCAAFTDFACQYGANINDMTTNCAATMLSYLHLYGRYPPGLFANTCKEDVRKGLRCLEDEISDAAVDEDRVSPLVFTTIAFSVYVLIIVLY